MYLRPPDLKGKGKGNVGNHRISARMQVRIETLPSIRDPTPSSPSETLDCVLVEVSWNQLTVAGALERILNGVQIP